jgi:thiamine-phosphate pyrophosphorylase
MTRLAVKAKIPLVQLRYKGDNDREFLKIACDMRKITSGTLTVFIVNDRLDIALASGADGVHLGQDNIDPRQARKLMGEDRIIGFSTHNLSQVRQAQKLPVDYIGFGPVWSTTSKVKPDPVTGINALKKAVEMSKHPVVAIGGITKERMKQLLEAKSNNVAVITAVSEAKDPYKEMKAINKQFLEQR